MLKDLVRIRPSTTIHHLAILFSISKLETNSILASHLVDIFAMIPQNVPSPTAFSGQETRLAQYRDVLAKLSTTENTYEIRDGLERATIHGESDYPSDEEDEDVQDNYQVIKTPKAGPFMGGFADV